MPSFEAIREGRECNEGVYTWGMGCVRHKSHLYLRSGDFAMINSAFLCMVYAHMYSRGQIKREHENTSQKYCCGSWTSDIKVIQVCLESVVLPQYCSLAMP